MTHQTTETRQEASFSLICLPRDSEPPAQPFGPFLHSKAITFAAKCSKNEANAAKCATSITVFLSSKTGARTSSRVTALPAGAPTGVSTGAGPTRTLRLSGKARTKDLGYPQPAAVPWGHTLNLERRSTHEYPVNPPGRHRVHPVCDA